MADFRGTRINHSYTQTNNAPPDRVFPLLCPVREAGWVPGWKYRMIYSRSGVAEDGCVFTTPDDGGGETTWLVTVYDPAQFRIEFAWVRPEMVAAQIRIFLEPNQSGTTNAHISYCYTGLSPEGNAEVERYDETWFNRKMQAWETAISHFLQTGLPLASPSWE